MNALKQVRNIGTTSTYMEMAVLISMEENFVKSRCDEIVQRVLVAMKVIHMVVVDDV